MYFDMVQGGIHRSSRKLPQSMCFCPANTFAKYSLTLVSVSSLAHIARAPCPTDFVIVLQ